VMGAGKIFVLLQREGGFAYLGVCQSGPRPARVHTPSFAPMKIARRRF